MDTIVDVLAPASVVPLLLPPPEAVAAGRLPLMAFVDSETERVLQESTALLGRAVIMRGGIAKAIEYLSAQRSPNLLIVDISGIDQPLGKIQTLADVCEPGTRVVVIGDQNDVGLYRDLIDIGCSNYIVKPLTRELLTKMLEPRRAVEIGKSLAKLGKVVSVVGARGGVGATTLAANFAWHLANKQSRRVALVDLDLHHGDCAMLFNVTPTAGFKDALSNPLRLDHLLLDRIMTQVGERLFLLGSEEPMQDDVHTTSASIDTLFSVLRSQFHFIVVDVPRIQAPAYRRALEMADRRVIVVDPTMRSMRDSTRIVRVFDDISEGRNLFVVNRVGEATNGLTTHDIEGVLQAKLTISIPFLPKLMSPAANHGEIAASKRGKFADALAKLAVEFADRRQWRWKWLLPWRSDQ